MMALERLENSPPAKEGWPEGPGWFSSNKSKKSRCQILNLELAGKRLALSPN